MQQYYGVIKITDVENITSDATEGQLETNLMNINNIRFVHYADCQQLILWLPEYFSFYERIEIKELGSGSSIYSQTISDIINGSIQIIIDTLFIHPGEFSITIFKKDGLQHIVQFQKYPEDQLPEVTEEEKSEVDLEKAPIIYRDGFGNILPNEDLILRERIILETIGKITRSLEYVSHGRDGEVIYIEGEKRIKFLMEMGAYNCIFYLNIPSESEWEKTTNFPLSERDDIIGFVAEQTLRDQASSCVYNITEREIAYYRKH